MKKAILLMLASLFPLLSFSTTCAQNYALDFGGVNDFKFVMVGPDTRFDTDGITVEAWIKPTSLPTGHYIYEGRSTIIWNGDFAGGQDPYIFYVNEYGALEAYADFQNGGFGEFIIDTTTVSLNEWHHVALTIDPSKMTLYLDGILVEELVHNRGPGVKNHSYVAIGRHLYYDNPFRGLMDEIRIWGVALTEQEIRNSMYAQLSGNENGLVAYWNFNQGSGQIAHDSTSSSINGVLGLNTQIEIYDPSWVLSDRPTAPPTKPITIDIMPRKHHENINLHSHGEITVAILSASEFYASDIVDKDSLTFGRTGDEDSLAFCYYRPEDIHGDGLKKDLVCHFYTEDTGFQCGDTVGILKGTTKDGTPIQGSDSVKIIPCKKPCKK